MLKRLWRAETGFFLAIWLGLMLVGRSRLFRDPGTFWHIAVGQHILSTGQLIDTDSFSFTFSGARWIAWDWLFACAVAVLHAIRGLDSILLATATALAGLYTWVAHRLLRAGLHWLLAAAVVALAIAASSYHFHPRPHLVTLILLGWTFSRLCDYEAGRISTKRLCWLIPVFVIWSNVHGGSVGGLGTLALAVTGWGLARRARMDTPLNHYRQLVPLSGIILACGATAFVNPYGTDLPRVWFSVFGSGTVQELIQEHGPLLSREAAVGVVLFGVFYVVVLAGVWPGRLRVTWLIPLVWLGLAWTRIRHGPLFAITAVIAMADLFPHTRWAAWLSGRGSDLFQARVAEPAGRGRSHSYQPMLIPFVVVMTACLLQAAAVRVPVLGAEWVRLDRTYWPVDLLPALREYERSHPPGTPIFNDMLFGGFLIYYTPGLRVFIDDRFELYGEAMTQEYAHASQHEPAQVDRWAQQYGFERALVRTGSPFDRYLRRAEGWTVIQTAPSGTLYERSSFSVPQSGAPSLDR